MDDPEFAPDEIKNRLEFGRVLEKLRVRAGMSGREAARRADIPVTTLNGYLHGRNLPQSGGNEGFVRLLKVFGVADEDTVRQWFRTVDRIRRRPGPEPTDGAIPYLGLEAFDQHDADWFFGRTRITKMILDRVRERPSRGRPLFVVGSSGAGKSSVLRAGVMPKVTAAAEGNRLPLFMTPGKTPCHRLAALLDVAEADVSRELASDEQDALAWRLVLPALRQRLDADVRDGAVLIVDQFEEVFSTDVAARERQAFLHTIGFLADRVASGGPPTVVVLGMRADFFARATDDRMLAAALGDASVVVTSMDRDELSEVITGPAAKANLALETGLVELILRDLAPAGSDVACDPGALPLLAHALRMTWEKRENDQLTVAGYRHSGGIRGAVAQTAETIYGNLDHGGQECARSVFLRLVHTGDAMPDTRRRIPAEELDGGIGDLATEVIELFVHGRLLTVSADGVEIAHEALIHAWPRLRTWLDDDRAGHALHRRLGLAARSWREGGEDPDLLYRGGLLSAANDWIGEGTHERLLNSTERDFLAAANAGHAAYRMDLLRRRRRLRIFGSVIAVCVLIASAATTYAVTQSAANRHEHDLTQSRELASQANRFRTSDVSLAAQLSLAAYRISPTPQARASLLDATAAPLAARLLGPLQVLQAVAVTGDDTVLATAGTARQIQLWNRRPGGGYDVAGPPLPAGDDTVFSLAFSLNGDILAAGGGDKKVRLWDVSTPAHPVPLGNPLAGFGNTIFAVTFSRDGRLLAVGAADNTVRLFTVADPAHPRLVGAPLTGFSGYVQAVDFSTDNRTLAAASADHTVRLWNVTDPTHPQALGSPLTGPAGKVYSVVFSGDDRTLVAGSADKNVYLWNVSDLGHPVSLPLMSGASGRVNSVVVAPDDTTVAAASSDSSVRVWDRATGRVIVTLPHPGPVTGADFIDHGKTLVTVAADGATRLWPIPGQVIGDRANSVFSMEYGGRGSLLVTSAGVTADTNELWDTTDPGHPRQRGAVLTNPLTGAKFSGSVSISPDGRTVASGMDDGRVVLFDVSDPARPAELGPPLRASTSLVETLEFSHNGRLLAVGSDEHTVTLWDLSNRNGGVLTASLNGPANSVYSLSFSADDALLAAGSLDYKVWLWNIVQPNAPEPLPTLEGFAGYVHSVVFSPQGRLLAAGSADKTVRIWDLRDPGAPASVGAPLVGATNYVYSVAFSPDGKTLAAGGYDRTIWTWDVTDPHSPRWLATLGAPLDAVFVVGFAPDGRTLAAGTAEKALRLWDTDPERAAAKICAAVGQPITAREWQSYVVDRPYAPPC